MTDVPTRDWDGFIECPASRRANPKLRGVKYFWNQRRETYLFSEKDLLVGMTGKQGGLSRTGTRSRYLKRGTMSSDFQLPHTLGGKWTGSPRFETCCLDAWGASELITFGLEGGWTEYANPLLNLEFAHQFYSNATVLIAEQLRRAGGRIRSMEAKAKRVEQRMMDSRTIPTTSSEALTLARRLAENERVI